jgi:hypothetical protein
MVALSISVVPLIILVRPNPPAPSFVRKIEVG